MIRLERGKVTTVFEKDFLKMNRAYSRHFQRMGEIIYYVVQSQCRNYNYAHCLNLRTALWRSEKRQTNIIYSWFLNTFQSQDYYNLVNAHYRMINS